MSQKNAKRIRRAVRQQQTTLIKDFLHAIHNWNYSSRIKIALQILKKQKNKQPKIRKKKTDFKVKDLVRTNYIPEERHVIRQITHITPFEHTPSNYLISVDGGTTCKRCKLTGHPIRFVDASLFVKVKAAAPDPKDKK